MSALSFADLQGNDLTTLPDTLDGLVTLDTLYLQNNQISSLPATIGDLDDLDTLYLNANQLTSLPDEFADMDALQRVLLNANFLTTLPALRSQLTTLQWLHAYNNTGMVGPVPISFSALTSLTQFYVYNNALNRTNTGYAYIDPSLTSWYNGITTKHVHGQSDITAPILSGDVALPALVT